LKTAEEVVAEKKGAESMTKENIITEKLVRGHWLLTVWEMATWIDCL
jgi:hypothetical protein